MKEQYDISSNDINEVIGLIHEYLFKGGTGFDNEAIERVLIALQQADRIEIYSEETGK